MLGLIYEERRPVKCETKNLPAGYLDRFLPFIDLSDLVTLSHSSQLFVGGYRSNEFSSFSRPHSLLMLLWHQDVF